MNNLVHEDDPWAFRGLTYWTRLRAFWSRRLAWCMHIFPVILTMIAGFSLALTQIRQEAVFFSIIGATLFLGLAINLASWPAKYQIFNDRIRVILGYLWHFDVPFNNIENATAATWEDLWGLNLNFINSYSSDDILQITRKRGAKIHITPWDRKLFLENLNKALADWRRGNIQR